MKYLPINDYLPTVYHEVKHKQKDRITPIYFGEMIKQPLPPTVYWDYQEYPDCNMLVFCYFHRKDWTDSIWRIMQKLDSHEFDFEGVAYCLDDNGEVLWTATRYHNELKVINGDVPAIFVEACGHGIKPYDKRHDNVTHVICPDKFNVVSIKEHHHLFERRIYPVFKQHGVTSWREWDDWLVKRKFGLRTAGLLGRDPMKFYKYAKKALRVHEL